MAVRLFLSSGRQRLLEAADEARLDGLFFIVTRKRSDNRDPETVLTLRAEDVVAAEVVKDGATIKNVLGSGRLRSNGPSD
jgi:hypothetical protein